MTTTTWPCLRSTRRLSTSSTDRSSAKTIAWNRNNSSTTQSWPPPSGNGWRSRRWSWTRNIISGTQRSKITLLKRTGWQDPKSPTCLENAVPVSVRHLHCTCTCTQNGFAAVPCTSWACLNYFRCRSAYLFGPQLFDLRALGATFGPSPEWDSKIRRPCVAG